MGFALSKQEVKDRRAAKVRARDKIVEAAQNYRAWSRAPNKEDHEGVVTHQLLIDAIDAFNRDFGDEP